MPKRFGGGGWVSHLCHKSLSLEMSLSRMGTRRSDIASHAPGHQHVRVHPPSSEHQLAAGKGDRPGASWRTHQSRRRASAAEDCGYLQTAHAPHTHGQRCRHLSLHMASVPTMAGYSRPKKKTFCLVGSAPLEWGFHTRPWRLSPEGRRGRTPGPRIMLPHGSAVQIAWWSTKVASLLAVGLRKTTQTIVTAV